jgi:hypothetical protein
MTRWESKNGILSAGELLDSIQGDNAARGSRPDPDGIVSIAAQRIDRKAREGFVCQEKHLSGDRVGLVFMCQVTRIRETSKNIFSCKTRIVLEDLPFRLAGCEEFQKQFHRDSSAADHGFPRENLWIYFDSLRPSHASIIPPAGVCQVSRHDRGQL